MGRLIDFDVCEKILTEFYESSLNDHDAMLFVEFMAQLENVPTAYDVEKVVGQLENHRAKFDCRTCKYNKTEKQVCTKDCTDALIDGLLEIVRKGGVE